MKKFIVEIFPFVVFCVLITIMIPVSIDPYNVFHVNHVRDNGIEPNKNYIKMSYILENPDIFECQNGHRFHAGVSSIPGKQ